MKHVSWSVLALWTTAACAVHFTPMVTPQKIPPVSPPIQARALLLITPSFEEYLAREKNGLRQVFHFGEAATKALSTLVTESFAVAEIRRVAAVDVPSLVAGPADTSVVDIVLVPSFESAGARLRMTYGDPVYISTAIVDSLHVSNQIESMKILAGVALRLNARSFRTGRTFTWVSVGGTGPVEGSWQRATGLALESALHVLSDSLAAHRAELELDGHAVQRK